MDNQKKAKEIADSLWEGEEMNGTIIRAIATTSAYKMAGLKDEQAVKAFCSIRCAEESNECTRECPFKKAFIEELKK